jgi:predicted alpha/beta superfamily hydrolase
MDSQWDFPLVNSIYGQQYYDGFIPEVIIAGITWGGSKPNPDSLRARDYTPTRVPGTIQSGGADKFLQFMKEELFPFMKSNYRADLSQSVLMGCSLGGLFTLYTLFTQPSLFSGYIAASPAIGWDNEVLYQFEKKYAADNNRLPARLYMTIGEVELNVPNFERFDASLKTNLSNTLKMQSRILENTGHSGTKSETYSRGLQFIFQRPDIKVEDRALRALTGTYSSTTGRPAEIKMENHQLTIQLLGAGKFFLKASSPSVYYSTAFFLQLEFTSNPTGFRLTSFGNNEVFLKK